MADKQLKRPRDPIQLAKLIEDIATGQVKDLAGALSSKQRTEAAKKAAKARWTEEPSPAIFVSLLLRGLQRFSLRVMIRSETSRSDACVPQI